MNQLDYVLFLFKRKEPLSSIPIDRRRKVETQGAVRRQVLSSVNRQDVTTNSDVGSTDECSKVEFTKDEVLALLNERAKAGKFDTKVCLINVLSLLQRCSSFDPFTEIKVCSQGKIEQMTDIIRRLKVCVRWFQQGDETHVQEKEDLRSCLESAEKRCSDKGDFITFVLTYQCFVR